MPVLISFVLGMFSMGFQLLGSRLLSPWFGSSIVVWAFLISTFLAAFSMGSLVGAGIVRLPERRRRYGLGVVLAVAALGFVFNAALGGVLLSLVDRVGLEVPLALSLSCGVLFLPPICALAALTPLLIQRQCESGQLAGYASGLIYSVGTVGNIAGIMLTVFFLIPRWPVSALLWFWAAAIVFLSWGVWKCLRG